MKVNCEICKTELERTPYQIKKSKTKTFFCGRKCRSKWDSIKFYNDKVNAICKQCNKSFKVIKSDLEKRIFCSKECDSKYRHISGTQEIRCDECGIKFKKIKSGIKDYNFCQLECLSRWNSKKNNKSLVTCYICSKEHYVKNVQSKTYKTCSLDCHYKYLKELGSSDEYREKMRLNALKSLQSSKKSDTKPERMVKEYLIKNNINFESQKDMYDKFVVDFYIIEKDIILEVYGDYWHSNPDIYNEVNKPNDMQIRQSKRDKSREAYLKKCGHTFLKIWERDIYDNIEEAMKIIE